MDTMDTMNTVELLSHSSKATDLWELMDVDIQRQNPLLYFPPNSSYVIRLVGPFIKAERIFIPQDIAFDKSELIDVFNGNSTAFERLKENLKKDLKKDVKEKIPPKKNGRWNLDDLRAIPTGIVNIDQYVYQIPNGPNFFNAARIPMASPIPKEEELYSKLNAFLVQLYSKFNWQSCVMSNVLVREGNDGGHIKVIPLISTICEGIYREISRISNNIPEIIERINISGLNAHDIQITKEGQGLQSRFNIRLSNTSTSLSKRETEHLFSESLWNIQEIVAEMVNRPYFSYFYRVVSDYKMPKKFYKELLEELKESEECDHLQTVDEKINELPVESFGRTDIYDPINSLDL